MKLYTSSKDPEWERIVHICVESCSGISKYINDKNTYKLVLVREGTVVLEGEKVTAPCLVMISNRDVAYEKEKGLSTTTVFFRPTEIRDEFTFDRIKSGEFEDKYKTTIYQDYLLIDIINDINIKKLSIPTYERLTSIIDKMDKNLMEQYDGFWPCRSRSYMMELLYFIRYIYEEERENDVADDDMVLNVIQYFSQHIGERILLDDVVKMFSTNRNKLNAAFTKEKSMTCMNYLTKMRIDLSKIMLAETELHVSEIADRVGYEDPNYFVKVYKKNTGMTPSAYRNAKA